MVIRESVTLVFLTSALAPMPLPSAQPRKAYDRTAYAALKSDDDRTELAPVTAMGAAMVEAEPADVFLQESEKLAQLRAALWQAFQSGPTVALPAALIDLTVAYTSAPCLSP